MHESRRPSHPKLRETGFHLFLLLPLLLSTMGLFSKLKSVKQSTTNPSASSSSAPPAPTPTRQVSNSFVQRQGHQLWLDGNAFRFASLNAPELLDGECNREYEVTNTMETFGKEGAFGGVGVTRTYTLRVSLTTSRSRMSTELC